MHKHWSRAQLVIDAVNSHGRKLGKHQTTVLKALLQNGTYPGTWYWQNNRATQEVLQSLLKRGLVTTEHIDRTDMRGDPDPQGRKTTFYRPALWMRRVMDATDDEVPTLLEAAEK